MPASTTTSTSKPDGDKSFDERYAEHIKKVAESGARLLAARKAHAKRMGRVED